MPHQARINPCGPTLAAADGPEASRLNKVRSGPLQSTTLVVNDAGDETQRVHNRTRVMVRRAALALYRHWHSSNCRNMLGAARGRPACARRTQRRPTRGAPHHRRSFVARWASLSDRGMCVRRIRHGRLLSNCGRRGIVTVLTTNPYEAPACQEAKREPARGVRLAIFVQRRRRAFCCGLT